MRYENVSGHTRIIMLGITNAVKVEPGGTVDVDDPALIAGLEGQQKRWRPVAAPVDDVEDAEE